MDTKVFFLITIVIANSAAEIQENEQFFPIVTEECLARGYCETAANYPEELALSIISKLKKKGFKHRVPSDHGFLKTELISVKNSLNYTSSPMLLCRSTLKYVTPRAARDIFGKWHFILNSEETPIQRYRTVVCHPYPQNCEKYFSFPGSGYEAMCQQKKARVQLIALDRFGHPVISAFEIDCCCNCDAARKNTILRL